MRDIERMSKEQEEKEKKSAEEKPQLWGAQASIFTELELALTSELGRKVKVVCSGKDAGGSLQLQFFDEEDLRQLAQKLTRSKEMEYEYKVVPVQNEVGFDFNKKCARLEEQMNRLGKEGWRFCAFGNGVMVYLREKQQLK